MQHTHSPCNVFFLKREKCSVELQNNETESMRTLKAQKMYHATYTIIPHRSTNQACNNQQTKYFRPSVVPGCAELWAVSCRSKRNISRSLNQLMSVVFCFLFFFRTSLPSSFWTSRGHRCRPFSPPVLAFNFYRAKDSAIPLLVDFPSSVCC